MLIFNLGLIFGTTHLPADLREALFSTMNPTFQTQHITIGSPDKNFEAIETAWVEPFLARLNSINPDAVCAGIAHFLFLTQAIMPDGSINTLKIPDTAPDVWRRVADFYIGNIEISDKQKQRFEQLKQDLNN